MYKAIVFNHFIAFNCTHILILHTCRIVQLVQVIDVLMHFILILFHFFLFFTERLHSAGVEVFSSVKSEYSHESELHSGWIKV